MIVPSPGLNPDRAAAYYLDDYTRGDDRAAGGAIVTGTWQGRGAERLGLTAGAAAVARADFVALLQGRSPADGSQLVAPQHGTGRRRAGLDFTASPDKTVSLAALVGPDPRIVAAHLAAAARALEVLEQQALAFDARSRLVPTGNLVVARFDHDTSRALDPHLHSHHLVLNLTERPAVWPHSAARHPDGRGRSARPAPVAGGGGWRALVTSGLFRAQSLATAVYHAELARGLRALGYEVSADARGRVGISGFPAAAVAAFSKRTYQVHAALARQSVRFAAPDPWRAAVYSRGKKLHVVDPAALRAAWQAEAGRLGVDLAGLRRAADERLDRRRADGEAAAAEPFERARAAVAWAVERLAEREAPCRAMDLEILALRRGSAYGTGLDEIRAATAAHSGLVPLGPPARALGVLPAEALVTTESAVRLQLDNLALVRAGRLPGDRPILARPYAGDGSLAHDQLRVVRHVLESGAEVLAVAAEPGAAKLVALAAAREAARAAGWSVRDFAVTAVGAVQLRQGGVDAATLKSLEAPMVPGAAGAGRPAPSDRGNAPPPQLWLVDQAERMSDRDAATALASARRAGARLVLVGDPNRRYPARETGRPWGAFQDVGLRPARLDPVRPPRDRELPRAVQLAAEGRAGDAIRHLLARSLVGEIAGARERHAAMVRELADAWVAGPDGRPDPRSVRDTLMIAPSHAERRDLNALARRELVARGALAPAGVSFETAVSRGLTRVQRTDLRHYSVGDVVLYTKTSPRLGFRAGDSARVVAVGGETWSHALTVERNRDGALVEYHPNRLGAGDLARVECLELTAGDRVRFQRLDRSRSIPADALATVAEAAPGRLVLELDARPARTAGTRVVTLDPGRAPLPLDYAYAVPPHAAEGATVRRVLATFDTRHGAGLVNRRQTELILSRASHQVIVYTDDRAALPAAVDRRPAPASALDLRPLPGRHHHAAAPRSRSTASISRRHTSRGPAKLPVRGLAELPVCRLAELPARSGSERPARRRSGRLGPADQGQPAERSGRAARSARGSSIGSASPATAPGRRPRARAGRRADGALRPRDPLPRPGVERRAREEPRPRRAALRSRRPGDAVERDSPLRRLGRPLDPGDPRRASSRDHGARPAEDPLAQKLIAAAERWHAARADDASFAAARQPAESPPRPPAAVLHRAPGDRGPLDALLRPRPAAAALSALDRLGDPERLVVRLVRQIGPERALAILPPVLARAVRGLRDVARLLAGPSLDR